MGKKKTKTQQSNRPIYSAQIEGAAGSQNAAYDRQLGAINSHADRLTGVSNDLFDQYYEGNPMVDAAQGYVTNTLALSPEDNPYLDDMVAQTGDNLMNRIRTQMGTRGGVGGSSELGILSDALSSNELNLRYQDYDRLMGRQAEAAGMAPGILASSYLPLDIAQQLGQQGAMLPIQAATANSGAIGGLLGQYQDIEGEQTQSPGFMDWAGLGLQSASLFSDRRLKTDVSRIGQTNSGTPIYTYRYQGKGPFHMGVMADDVPHARGPDIGGFATVRYEEVV